MACTQPFIYDPYYKNKFKSYYYYRSQRGFSIPCGWCLNCRIDKQNSLRDRCEYEYIHRKTGAFVTFTIDDRNMLNYMKYDSINKKLVASLSKYQTKKFLDRLNKLVHSQPDNILCQHDYKYLVVGEYGSHGDNPLLVNRPHLHILFFGLDFAFCKELFAKAWRQQGNIFVGNIGDGAIPYVLKYLDKQVFGDLAKMQYDNHGLERPFQTHSLSLGSGLYTSNIDYAIEHNNCYRWHGLDVPYPQYFKNKYLFNTKCTFSKQYGKKLRKSISDFKSNFSRYPRNLSELQAFKMQKNISRQNNLKFAMQKNGKIVYDTEHIKMQSLEYQINSYYPGSKNNSKRLNIKPVNIAFLVDTSLKVHKGLYNPFNHTYMPSGLPF